MKLIFVFTILSGFFLTSCNTSKTGSSIKTTSLATDHLLEELMRAHAPAFNNILANRQDLEVQIIYTQVDHDSMGKATFSDHFFNTGNNSYFYPASTVKLPVAILALQKLNELNVAGLSKYSTMLTGCNSNEQTIVEADPSSQNGLPSIAQYIRKIFLVSDNDAFNRLYEFLGQEYINSSLHRMGYRDVQIIHRLSVTLNEQQNRNTNPIRFTDSAGKTIYEQPALSSSFKYAWRHDMQGTGYLNDTVVVHKPFDFSKKNRISLNDLHDILRSVIFPNDVPAQQRFNLTTDDYQFLRKYMSMTPGQSDYPHYDSSIYPDTYVKHWIYGSQGKIDRGLSIYNKTGTAYGYLVDVAYFNDRINNVEFMLSGVIYCNSDGIFNDDHYDYDSIGYPFFKEVGKLIWDYEKTGRR